MPLVVKAPMDTATTDQLLKHEEFTTFKSDAKEKTLFKATGQVAQQFASQRTKLLKCVEK